MIRVAIVDHAIVRTGLRQFLAEHMDTPPYCQRNETLGMFKRKGGVDGLLLELSMHVQGSAALAAIRDRFPELAVLIFSGFPEAHYARASMRPGAEECEPEQIVPGIRTVARFMTPAEAEIPAKSTVSNGDELPHDSLSERELQVFLRLAKGEKVGRMAEAMSLSVKTVSTYRTRVMGKFKMGSNSELTYYALKNGLIQ